MSHKISVLPYSINYVFKLIMLTSMHCKNVATLFHKQNRYSVYHYVLITFFFITQFKMYENKSHIQQAIKAINRQAGSSTLQRPIDYICWNYCNNTISSKCWKTIALSIFIFIIAIVSLNVGVSINSNKYKGNGNAFIQ